MPIEVLFTDAGQIAYAYRMAHGDLWTAIMRAINYLLADLAAAERHTRRREPLISQGYVRSRPDMTGQ